MSLIIKFPTFVLSSISLISSISIFRINFLSQQFCNLGFRLSIKADDLHGITCVKNSNNLFVLVVNLWLGYWFLSVNKFRFPRIRFTLLQLWLSGTWLKTFIVSNTVSKWDFRIFYYFLLYVSRARPRAHIGSNFWIFGLLLSSTGWVGIRRLARSFVGRENLENITREKCK